MYIFELWRCSLVAFPVFMPHFHIALSTYFTSASQLWCMCTLSPMAVEEFRSTREEMSFLVFEH